MSDKEISRINVIQSVVEKRMRRRDAAHQLALTERQTQRLMNRFRESGAAGLVNLRRGRPGNHRLPESLKLRVLSLLHDHYSDFGPTLAAEKLRERHNITVSVETLRKWMTADGLWVPYSRRRPRVHQPRYRRDCLGELVQIDGSPHDWFEGRAPKCCLLVFIDDATGRLMHLRFGETESAFDYMMATREYLEQHGKPLAFYSDKHGIFRVNNGGSTTTGVTQFGRVLSELGIELICANSPQAKGRVERANQTLQDRLIKEMRLEGICSIEAANAWLDTFIADFNRRFARPAKYPKDLHRPVSESNGYRSLKYQVFDKLECLDQGQIVDNKRLGAVLKLAQSKMDELERDGKRDRSKKMPKRRAQARVQEQLRAINPVLVNPDEFRASLKR
ncbi:TPA: ISNCY family transposase [Klebsiella variicola]|nr:ISNCY family transposase [Klebsiella variicola]HDK6789625.1 ISNCY family transposase [Klebsiella variicola]